MDDMAKKNAYTTLGLKSGADERDVQMEEILLHILHIIRDIVAGSVF